MRRLLLFLAVLAAALPALAGDLEGYVYSSEGTALTGATATAYLVEGSTERQLRIEKHAARPALATAQSKDGRFALANLPDGIVDVDVRADGYAPVVVRTLVSDGAVSATLRRAPVAQGRVTVQGKPVANAWVVWSGINGVETAAATDPNGRYRMPQPGAWAQQVDIVHPAYVLPRLERYGLDTLQHALEPRPKDERPPARGAGIISGTVRVGKKPLAGAPVLVQLVGADQSDVLRVVTDAKGRYQAGGLAPGSYLVFMGEGLSPRLRSPNDSRMYEDESGPAVDLQKERTGTIDIDLFASPLISGRVTDADSQPVAGAQVQVILAGRSTFDFMQEPSVRTTPDGRYSIPHRRSSRRSRPR